MLENEFLFPKKLEKQLKIGEIIVNFSNNVKTVFMNLQAKWNQLGEEADSTMTVALKICCANFDIFLPNFSVKKRVDDILRKNQGKQSSMCSNFQNQQTYGILLGWCWSRGFLGAPASFLLGVCHTDFYGVKRSTVYFVLLARH